SPMLNEMKSRGPDSSGVAVYRNPAPEGATKFSLAQDNEDFDWQVLADGISNAFKCEVEVRPISTHCVLVTDADEKSVLAWLDEHWTSVRIVGSGTTVEIFKEVGFPEDVYARFDLNKASGTHIIGHTRMATESAVTTAGSHPFATGADLCLVHNGSFSNHNRLREVLRKEGLAFQTENDTEVAAAYLTLQLRKGASIRQALEDVMRDLDGFYTLCVGTRDGFAVLRDPIACKHAIIAETDDWVAMATEYRAIATLPGAENAKIWEPKPATIYTWGGEADSPMKEAA
ncbi:MAG: amidophosphoribosyltransferase, partial [Pseudomonadota bacterium]